MGAMVGQTLWSGVSAAQSVNDMWENSEQACKQNKALATTEAELVSAFSEGAVSLLAQDKLRSAVHGWHESLVNVHHWAVYLRRRFLQRYVIFLVALAIVTILLFFAVEKKAGRLDKLFRKIGRITDAMEKSAGHGAIYSR